MKKIIIIVIASLFLTACYDNIELDDLSIIGGIGIDYTDDFYYITYEIFNNNKSDDTQNLLSEIISGSGKTLSEAFIDANYKTGKKPCFAHMKVLLLSESIINGHLKDITDYLFRDVEIRDSFQVLVAKDISPKEILNKANTRHPVISNLIDDLLKLEKHNNNLATNETFKEIFTKLISKNADIILNTISIIDGNISLNNSYIFNGYNYQKELSMEESTLYNMLTKKTINTEFTKYYGDNNLTISINSSKTDISINASTIKIDAKLEGRIIENNPGFNLKDINTYKRLNKDFSIVIADSIKKFIKDLQNNNSDILGLQEIYYKNHNKNNKGLWKNSDIEINVDLKINTKGFIFEVIE